MSRYIDADALKRNHMFYHEVDNRSYAEERDIDETPTVDAVQVCRCRECKWCDYPVPNSTKYGCRLFDRCVKGDWFCADGERKDEERRTEPAEDGNAVR